jgi:hypothetical protein
VLFSADDAALHDGIAEAQIAGKGPLDVEAVDGLTAAIKRLLVFEDLDEVSEIIRAKLSEVVERFPRTLAQLEFGDGGRDILDPFIVAFGLHLLATDTVKTLLKYLVAHKCLMKLEDLIGHMHEDVLGRAAGKTRVREPEGIYGTGGTRNKEVWDAKKNPYPGADSRLQEKEFYQIKNKTGSAKGSDGEKLGRQFQQLGDKYPGSDRYYVSVIGKTLAGHRSMGAFLRTDPGAQVLVGLAAFQQLGGHRDTPSIVLDLVLEQFEAVKSGFNYELDAVADSMYLEWQAKYGSGDTVHAMLRDVISAEDPRKQQSRSYLRQVVEDVAEAVLEIEDADETGDR